MTITAMGERSGQGDIRRDHGAFDRDAMSNDGAAPTPSNVFGLHIAQDLAIVGGNEVCSQASQAAQGFACFEQGTDQQYVGEPLPGVGNKIASGYAIATTRLLLSYDRAVTTDLMIGARVGYAVGGGPAPHAGAPFLPVHAELRGSYWFGGALRRDSFRPYLHVGGGMAQVDAKLHVVVIDCSTAADGAALPIGHSDELDCLSGARQPPDVGFTKKLDVYKKLGRAFATAGGGVVVVIDENVGAELNLNLMAMLPSSGFVIEPSVGLVYAL